jgi:deazaflavin-dependent oxidoreductase (nitroreductase family)
VPLLYIAHRGDEIVVVASHGGMSRNPAWYLNLRDDPRATVDFGSRRREMTAQRATAAERAEIWPALTAAYPHFDAYQQRTVRQIPVLILSPLDPPDRRRTHLER